MRWLTWRQHRAEALTAAVVLAAVAAVLIPLGLAMHTASATAVACANDSLTDPGRCSAAMTAFQQDYGYTANLLVVLNLLPFAVGALIGAPLVARELETGTWQLAWTQAVPRMRWLAAKVLAAVAVTVALSAGVAALVTWFRQPLDAIYGRFSLDGFDVEGVAPVGYALFALTVGAAAGTLLRRTLPAVTVALAAFVAARIGVEGGLRPGFRKPFQSVRDVAVGSPGIPIGTGRRSDWMLDMALVQNGQRLTNDQLNEMADAASHDKLTLADYLHQHGVQTVTTYHPARTFWTFQYIEFGLFAATAAALLAVVVWRVRRRL
jgi:hypothetical protein